MRMTKIDFERQAKALEGQRIARVRYCEADYGVRRPRWADNPRFDNMEYGVELEMAGGEIYTVTWDSTFSSFGIAVRGDPHVKSLERHNIWDVSENSRWEALLLKEINRVDVYWERSDRAEYPQSIAVTFETGDVVHISDMEITDKRVIYFHSHITVIFDDAVAKEYRIGPYTPVTDDLD